MLSAVDPRFVNANTNYEIYIPLFVIKFTMKPFALQPGKIAALTSISDTGSNK